MRENFPPEHAILFTLDAQTVIQKKPFKLNAMIGYVKGDDQIFNCEDELTADNLDALWRQDMQDERNQQAFKDALRSTDPDEVDMKQRECEWKMTWDDDAWDRAREFELFDPEYPVEELEAQKEADVNQRLPAPVQTNTTQSVALVKTSGSPAQAIQPVHGTVLSRPAQNAVRGRVGITPYEAAQGLIQTIPMFCIGKGWLVYQQGYYALESSENVKRIIMEVCRPAVEQCGSANFVDHIFKILKTEPKLFIRPDFNCNCVAFDDCVLDLDRWEKLVPTPTILVTTHLRASFSRGKRTDCPEFKRFLADVTFGNSVLQERIWQAVGYLLVPDQHGKAIILLQGRKHSGKSVLVNVVKRCFDDELVVALSVNEFDRRFATSSLYGKKLCVDADLSDERLDRIAVSVLKKLTGSDSISGDVKFGDYLQFENSAKFLYGSNHVVLLPNKDAAFYDRLVVIPFARTVPSDERDFRLEEKLNAERDAIIVQALAAYRRLVKSNYRFAGDFPINAVTEDGGESTADKVSQFLREDCEIALGVWTPTGTLYAAFVRRFGNLCSDKSFSGLLFSIALSAGYPVGKDKNRTSPKVNSVWGFANLKLKEKADG